MPNILLLPAHAVTCNATFDVLIAPAIHIENGAITYLGPRATQPEFRADETIADDHFVALPGLINTHTHTAMTLLRGYADDMALEPWLQEKIWPFEANLTPDDVILGTELAALEMLRGGTTCCADMYFCYEQGAQVFIDSGLRACPGGVLLGFLPNAEQRLNNAIAFARDWQNAGDGRITPFLAPHSLYTCNPSQWKTFVAAAHEYDLILHTHVAETPREIAEVRAQWGEKQGQTPLQVLAALGALDGPLLGAHGVYLDERDWQIISEKRDQNQRSNFRLAHNPTSNLKLASGFADVRKYLQHEISVGIGTDGAASNNDLDMWEEMRLTALIHKATTGDATVVSAQQALQMATIEGAKCLNLDAKIGSLEVGKRADIVLMDFDKPHLTPLHNVVSHLVYAAKASDVDTVIIDGQIRVRGGEVLSIDSGRVLKGAQKRALELASLAS